MTLWLENWEKYRDQNVWENWKQQGEIGERKSESLDMKKKYLMKEKQEKKMHPALGLIKTNNTSSLFIFSYQKKRG